MDQREAGPGTHRGPSGRTKGWLAVAAVIALTVAGWMAWRHWEDGRWDNQAIAAQFKDFTVERQNERDVHLLLRYQLTNATRSTYQLAPPRHGVLMRRVPEGDLEEIDSVVWEPVVIPAGKTANAEFDVTLPLAPDTAGAEAEAATDDQDLKDLANRELAHMQGLVFFDYGKRYWIDLPKGWP